MALSLNGFTSGNSNFTKKLVLLGIVLLVIILVFGLEKILTPPVQSRFISDVMKGNAKGSYALTSSGFRSTESSDEWSAQVSKLSQVYTGKPQGTGEKILSTPSATGGKITLYSYRVEGTGGPYSVNIYVVKEGGKAKVSSFEATSISAQ